MSAFWSTTACQQVLAKILEEHQKLSSRQSINFADCRRLCDVCLLFQDSNTLKKLGQVELEVLVGVFQKVHSFLLQTTRRTHFRDMMAPQSRKRHCEQLAELHFALEPFTDWLFLQNSGTSLSSSQRSETQKRNEAIEVRVFTLPVALRL
jgi:hypothetical protein